MSFARDTMLIFRRQMKLSLRNPAWVIIGLIQPILYLDVVMFEGVAVSIGLAVVCLWLAGRMFIRENA
jgi:ABC-2 type transport system permease protein